MAKTDVKVANRDRRHKRVRRKIVGTAERPRLAVFRSARHIYAQVIDDATGSTIAAASTRKIEGVTAGDKEGRKAAEARAVGKMVAELAKAKGVEIVRFDRGGYLYHGRVAALAAGAREAGLQF